MTHDEHDSHDASGEQHAEAYCSSCNQSFAPEVERCPNDGARLIKFAASRDPLIGRVLDGRFEVREPLGRGGMGTVYRAIQLSVDREVAIKVVHPKLADDRQAAKRFLREARLASRLNQPSVVQVIDFGQTDDGVLYLVMELLRGRTLAKEQAGQRLALKRVLAIGGQLCDALEAAHAQGIVHRDLKPGNIVVLADPPGRDLLKVLDFGLAKSLVTDTSSKVTNTDAILGTPLYMSPEQVQGKGSEPRSDLYALGCILYELLTGAPPFVDPSVNLILAKHLSEPPPPLPASVPPRLRALVAQLLAKDPAERPATAADARAVLQWVLDGGAAAWPEPDVSDTVPDVPAEFAQTIAQPMAPAPSAAAVTAIAPTRRWWLPAAIAVGALAVGGYALLGGGGDGDGGGARPAVAPVVDAAAVAPPAIDAAIAVDTGPGPVDAAPIDAAAPVDARRRDDRDHGARAPVDAGPRKPTPVDAGPTPRPPIDAAELDFYPGKR